MNIEQILKLAAGSFQSQLGGAAKGLGVNGIVAALSALLMKDGKLDIAGLVSQMQSGGLASLAASWLGDGGNMPIDARQIAALFGQSRLQAFAGQLGLDQGQALKGLEGALPVIIDKASSGGALQASLGDVGAVLGSLGKLFGR
ncbi:MAG TPA: YidB family protein [Xanthomonadaceae bacterium]|nr:YidB family protein [Xanthomonadaceae bacterium]